METFSQKIAVVTGAGTGMGRELVRQLTAKGADVAACDVMEENLLETAKLADREGHGRITTHLCDVSNEKHFIKFRDEVASQHQTEHIDLLFNNAGIGGGGSLVDFNRRRWERTFDVCWYGVYFGCITFLPMLIAGRESHIVNTSSVNGFWASLGPHVPHTAYSAAKFAVKGFTEALITDLRLYAPHVTCSVVMPGHVGTSIALNSRKLLRQTDAKWSDDTEAAMARDFYRRLGISIDGIPDDRVMEMIERDGEDFRDKAETSAEEAVEIILAGVAEKRWRILVGEDAKFLDESSRNDPESAYEVEFYDWLVKRNTKNAT